MHAGSVKRDGRLLRHRHRDRHRLCGRTVAYRRADRADGAQPLQLLRVQPMPDVRDSVEGEDLPQEEGPSIWHSAPKTGLRDPSAAVPIGIAVTGAFLFLAAGRSERRKE